MKYVCDNIYEYILNENLHYITNLLTARLKFPSEGTSSDILVIQSRSLYSLSSSTMLYQLHIIDQTRSNMQYYCVVNDIQNIRHGHLLLK